MGLKPKPGVRAGRAVVVSPSQAAKVEIASSKFLHVKKIIAHNELALGKNDFLISKLYRENPVLKSLNNLC